MKIQVVLLSIALIVSSGYWMKRTNELNRELNRIIERYQELRDEDTILIKDLYSRLEGCK